MSRELESPNLPVVVKELFDGERAFECFGLAYELVTIDSDGRPRIAMLSHGEILTVDERLRFALWANTNTGKNLAAQRPCMLSVVDTGFVCYLAGHARKLWTAEGIDVFELAPDSVRVDEHEGLPVTHAIRFEAEDDATTQVVFAQWRTQIATMRKQPL